MLSPDPVTQAPENGQNYDRYTYAFNNPLRNTDPSGYMNELGGGVSVGVGGTSGGIVGGGDRDYTFRIQQAADAGDVYAQAYLDGTLGELLSEEPVASPSNDGCTGGLSTGGLCSFDGATQVAQNGGSVPQATQPEITSGDFINAVGDIADGLSDSQARQVITTVFGAQHQVVKGLPKTLTGEHVRIAGDIFRELGDRYDALVVAVESVASGGGVVPPGTYREAIRSGIYSALPVVGRQTQAALIEGTSQHFVDSVLETTGGFWSIGVPGPFKQLLITANNAR